MCLLGVSCACVQVENSTWRKRRTEKEKQDGIYRGSASARYLVTGDLIYTTMNTTDGFRNVSATEVGVAGWAWCCTEIRLETRNRK